MSTNKQRRPPGRVLYIVFWIGAVLIGFGFLGNLPHLIPDFLRDYSRDHASAFEALIGQMIVWAIGVFCIMEIIDANKARGEQATESKPENDAPSPEPLPASSPAFSSSEHMSPALLNVLKEELFTLESEKLSSKLTQEQYAEAKTGLEARVKLAYDSSHSGSGPLGPAGPGNERGPKEPKLFSIGSALRILAVSAWTALIVFNRYGFSAGALGFWIGVMVIPFLISSAIAGPKRGESWYKFSYWFLALGILCSGLALSNQKSLTNLSPSDMLKELAGTKPLEENLPQREKEMAAVTKAIFSDFRASNKTENEQIEALKPDIGKIYTSESFSSKDTMQRAKDSLNKALSLDRETEAMLERMPESVKARLDLTNLSDADKSSFMKNFFASFNSPDYVSARSQVITAETEWVYSVNDLYSFSLQHSSEIEVSKDKIGITRDATRAKFNQKFSRAQDLQSIFLAATKKQADLRDAVYKKQGISLADMGLDK